MTYLPENIKTASAGEHPVTRLGEAMRQIGYRFETPSPDNKDCLAYGGNIYPTIISPDGFTKVALDATDLFLHDGNVWLGAYHDVKPDRIQLAAIVVDPDHRGQGLASKMIQDIHRVADSIGMTIVGEPVMMKNFVAKKQNFLTTKQLSDWYKRHGWTRRFPESDKILWRQPQPPKQAHRDNWYRQGADARICWRCKRLINPDGSPGENAFNRPGSHGLCDPCMKEDINRPPCHLCSAVCCKDDGSHEYAVWLSTEESGDFQHRQKYMAGPHSSIDVIPYVDGVCPYLRNNACSIYNKRPKRCQAFSCLNNHPHFNPAVPQPGDFLERHPEVKTIIDQHFELAPKKAKVTGWYREASTNTTQDAAIMLETWLRESGSPINQEHHEDVEQMLQQARHVIGDPLVTSFGANQERLLRVVQHLDSAIGLPNKEQRQAHVRQALAILKQTIPS